MAVAAAAAALGALPQQSGRVDLLTQANVRIDGAAPNDGAGSAIAPAGDVNGDGIGDVIVGAPDAGNEGRLFSGSAYVVFGRTSPGTVDLANLGANGFRIDGATYHPSASGLTVAAAGDVNGDGLADLIVGFPGDGNNSRANSGSAYVVFGKRSTSTVDLANLGSGGFRIDGANAGDELGWSVAGVGDFNGDGLADVIVGAPFANNNAPQFKYSGAAYVVYGKKTTTTIDLADYNTFQAGEGLRIDGGFAGQTVGWSVSGVGDVTGDGRPDVIVGAPYGVAPYFQTDVGSAYVIYGTASTGTIDTGAFTPTLGYRIDGITAEDGTGEQVAGAGDVNGDGVRDVLVGAADPVSTTGNGYSTSVYVVFGKPSTDPVKLAALGAGGFRIEGAVVPIGGPPPLAGAGDVNGDGLADILVASPNTDENGRLGSGTAYVVFGKASTTTVDLSNLGSGGFEIDGAAAGDLLSSVAAAGDFNGDGRPDLIVGAYDASNNDRTYSGSAYILDGYGTPQLAYDPLTATAGTKITPHGPSRLKRTGQPSFTITPALPAGLSLDPNTGVITGTPTTGQATTNYTVTMTDLAGKATAPLSIEIKASAPPPPPPPPPARKLTLKAGKLTISKARAGKPFTVSMTVQNAATHKGVKGQVACTGKLAGKPLRATRRSSTTHGKASCTWKLPKNASGKQFKGSITERYRKARISRSFSTKVH